MSRPCVGSGSSTASTSTQQKHERSMRRMKGVSTELGSATASALRMIGVPVMVAMDVAAHSL